MPFASVLSTKPDSRQALEEIIALGEHHHSGEIDLALLFYSPHHAEAAKTIAKTIQNRLRPRCLLGCPGESIIGNDREVENHPALSLWLGRWPGQDSASAVQITPFQLVLEQTSEGLSLLGWPDEIEEAQPDKAALLVLADPFTLPIDDFLGQVNDEYPGLRVMGGMASGGHQPGDNLLIFGDQIVREGAVAVLLRGNVKIRSVVSQGCRPIGRPLVITKAQDNVILELGGKPPLAHLQQLWRELDPHDQELLQQGLHIGRVINEYQDSFHRGDFLVRNAIGLDRNTGALAITDRVRTGQTVQFHVRDAATADEDLHALLQLDAQAHPGQPAAALLFSCNGRGTRLFPEPNHDAQAIRREKGNLPLAGFFAQGELGPIGGQNFIHGFTASVVLFEE